MSPVSGQSLLAHGSWLAVLWGLEVRQTLFVGLFATLHKLGTVLDELLGFVNCILYWIAHCIGFGESGRCGAGVAGLKGRRTTPTAGAQCAEQPPGGEFQNSNISACVRLPSSLVER